MDLDKKAETSWNVQVSCLSSVLFSSKETPGFLNVEKTMVIFEVLMYVVKDQKATEISCGWAQASL